MTTPVRLPQDTALLVLGEGATASRLHDGPLAALLAAWRAADMPRAILTPVHDPVADEGLLSETDTGIPVMTHGPAGIFAETDLDARLTAAGITTLVLAAANPLGGLAKSCADATGLGYRVIIMGEEAGLSDVPMSVADAKIAPPSAIVAGVELSASRKRPWLTQPSKAL
ncbi:cysteine hydrolase family protein [Chelatococcus asaccharovorans]|uniref:isochorismatase family protein n=1 Tax=Chelatococcus asaccharovorans TaxID=28210 RepID=UPI00224C6ECE|nr:isochorismatase family protein [Chelatococcus asaccharovorans]CAH1661580.1 Isochorismatase family protein [Chelatococcus asaccharovorans]CAH1683425.1 Isochorismatase family protein [Chelatococcus asaccharovorans]